MKNTIISKFKNIKDTTPTNISLLTWLIDDSMAKTVEKIRNIKDKDERSKLKALLPAITPSGIFSKRRMDGLIEHSGYLCIDIDSGDNPDIHDFENLRDQISNIDNIAYASLSVSGQGVFGLIPIKYPDKHKEHFEALKVIFKKLGIALDKACGDVTRLRIYSYDKNAYFNENAITFEKTLSTTKQTTSYVNNKISKNISSKSKVLKIIGQLGLNNLDLTDTYEKWFQIGCAFANEFGEEGRDLYHLVSENHPKYQSNTTDTKFSEFLNNSYGYTIGTFFHYAKEFDIK